MITQLSEHFSLQEMCRSQTAVRLGLSNMPSGNVVINLTKLAAMLEQVRSLLNNNPLIISSAYRALLVNRAVGSQDTSAHILGGAADVECPGFGTPLECARVIAESGLPFGQLIHEFGSWFHISILPVAIPINRIITIDHSGTRAGLLEVRT